MTVRFRGTQRLQWQPLDDAAYLCLSSGPSLSPLFLFPLSPSLSHWVTHVLFLVSFSCVGKRIRALANSSTLETLRSDGFLAGLLFHDQPSVYHFCLSCVRFYTTSAQRGWNCSFSHWPQQLPVSASGTILGTRSRAVVTIHPPSDWVGWLRLGGGAGLTAPALSCCCWQIKRLCWVFSDVGGIKDFSVLLIVKSDVSQCGAEPTVHCLTVGIVQHGRLLQWFGSKDRRIRRPLASFSPIRWSFIASNDSLLDLGAHLGKAGSGLVLGLQRGTSQDEEKDEVMSQRMQYYTKRPY